MIVYLPIHLGDVYVCFVRTRCWIINWFTINYICIIHLRDVFVCTQYWTNGNG